MERDFLLHKGLLKIPCKLTEPEDGDIRRVVLGVHGLGGGARDDIQANIAEEMELFCSATVRFDFPGHGESPLDGQDFCLQNCKDSLLAAAEFAKDRYPRVEDLCIFATGFGAYIVLCCMDELLMLPGKIKLVVQTPSVLMHETLLAMGNVSEQELCSRGKVTFQTERCLEVSWQFYEELRENIVLNSYPAPFLILQGEADDFIPMEDILHLRRINEQAKLVIIPGATHRFQEEGAWDMVLDLTRDWFAYEQVLVTDWE